MKSLFTILKIALRFITPVKTVSKGAELPAEKSFSWPKGIVIVMFLCATGYSVYFSDAPVEERKQQIELVEDVAEGALDLLDD